MTTNHPKLHVGISESSIFLMRTDNSILHVVWVLFCYYSEFSHQLRHLVARVRSEVLQPVPGLASHGMSHEGQVVIWAGLVCGEVGGCRLVRYDY